MSPLLQDLKYFLFQILPGEFHHLISEFDLCLARMVWSENDPTWIKVAKRRLSAIMNRYIYRSLWAAEIGTGLQWEIGTLHTDWKHPEMRERISGTRGLRELLK